MVFPEGTKQGRASENRITMITLWPSGMTPGKKNEKKGWEMERERKKCYRNSAHRTWEERVQEILDRKEQQAELSFSWRADHNNKKGGREERLIEKRRLGSRTLAGKRGRTGKAKCRPSAPVKSVDAQMKGGTYKQLSKR